MSALERRQGWPATLTEPSLLDAALLLRPLRVSDARIVHEARARNATWLSSWEPSDPTARAPRTRRPENGQHDPQAGESPIGSFVSLGYMRLFALAGLEFPWVIRYGDQFAGQVTLRSIARGPSRSAEVAYWIDENFAGRGITPTAVAMVADHCFGAMRMHRIEAGIRPDNIASKHVVEKLGFRQEGTRVRAVHYDGGWQDHDYYAITAEEVPEGMLSRWRSRLERQHRLRESALSRDER